uniref:Grh/CP2 DB domain-containing protein n=1 Tax=Clastoptera arizonana TaxID=38151 RepID=A0A1B6C8A3_9HEMI
MVDQVSLLDEQIDGENLDLNCISWNPINNCPTMSKKKRHVEENNTIPESQQEIVMPKPITIQKIQRIDSGSSARFTRWRQDVELTDDLTSDLDGTCSLSALGVDLNSTSYSNSRETCICPIDVDTTKNEATNSSKDSGYSNHIQPLYLPYDLGINDGDYRSCQSNNINCSKQNSTNFPEKNSGFEFISTSTGTPLQFIDDCRFQYVLAAATSRATKLNEDTLTYLNQGQSYEIRLKKLGDLTEFRGKILKSMIRLCFQERRLQCVEKEKIAAWVAARPNERILEVDISLSYGVFDLVQDPLLLNTIEFLWDPTKDVGLYIKVNCVSTEFTPNKHGGEKGVPFLIQVDTKMHGEKMQRKLHSGSCQIKVFKLKGAERKHKQDRMKILKLPLDEQENYQPSCECTVLNDLLNNTGCMFGSPGFNKNRCSPSPPIRGLCNVSPARHELVTPPLTSGGQDNVPGQDMIQDFANNTLQKYETPLNCDSITQQTSAWLQSHRFSTYLHTFSGYSGADLLRLSRDDLIQICGLADGIRLFNALHTKTKTVYVCVQSSPSVYHALYLANLSSQEMATKIAVLLGITVSQIQNIFMMGPSGIHVVMSDDLVYNIKDGATYAVEMSQGELRH